MTGSGPPDRGRKRTRSASTYWTTHSDPKATTLAASTATVWTAWLRSAVWADARPTATDDTARPVNDSVQKGTTCPATERRPVTPHTHRRLSSNDGTVPTAVATTLATTAGVPTRPTSTPRTTRLVTVDTSDTPEYRTSRRTTARCRPVRRTVRRAGTPSVPSAGTPSGRRATATVMTRW